MFTCTLTPIDAHTHTLSDSYLHTQTHTCVHTQTRSHTQIHTLKVTLTHISAYSDSLVFTLRNALTHTLPSTHTHTHTHGHTHSLTHSASWPLYKHFLCGNALPGPPPSPRRGYAAPPGSLPCLCSPVARVRVCPRQQVRCPIRSRHSLCADWITVCHSVPGGWLGPSQTQQ